MATTPTSKLPVAVTHMTFDDEFNTFSNSADGINTTWMTDFLYTGEDARTLPGSDEAEWYSDPSVGEDPFSDSNGILSITATPAAPGSNPYNLPYDSGVITTYKSFAQLYGYFEVSAELPAGAGLWPAFWMVPASGNYTAELDVFENLGDPTQIYSSEHGTNNGSWTNITKQFTVPNASTGFHTYGVDWEPTTTTFYVDGVAVGSEPTLASMDVPMYMILDLAVGGAGSWPGQPTSSAEFPATMQIDYVRAYATANTRYVGGAAALAPTQSLNDTVITASGGGIIVDASGNSWTIANGEVAVNGTADATTSNVIELAYVNGEIWEENSAHLWAGKTAPGNGWSASTKVPPISATVTNAVTHAVSYVDATVAQDVMQASTTFDVTAPGVASVTIGSTASSLAFLGMSSLSVTAGTAKATISVAGGNATFTAGRAMMDITGGPGADTYVFNRGAVGLIIEDFVPATDTLQIDPTLKTSLKIAADGHGGSLLSFGTAAGTIDLVGQAGFSSSAIHWAA